MFYFSRRHKEVEFEVFAQNGSGRHPREIVDVDGRTLAVGDTVAQAAKHSTAFAFEHVGKGSVISSHTPPSF